MHCSRLSLSPSLQILPRSPSAPSALWIPHHRRISLSSQFCLPAPTCISSGICYTCGPCTMSHRSSGYCLSPAPYPSTPLSDCPDSVYPSSTNSSAYSCLPAGPYPSDTQADFRWSRALHNIHTPMPATVPVMPSCLLSVVCSPLQASVYTSSGLSSRLATARATAPPSPSA